MLVKEVYLKLLKNKQSVTVTFNLGIPAWY